jgi:hypothetical protein
MMNNNTNHNSNHCRKRGRATTPLSREPLLFSFRLSNVSVLLLVLAASSPPVSWGFQPATANRDGHSHLSASTAIPPPLSRYESVTSAATPRFFRDVKEAQEIIPLPPLSRLPSSAPPIKEKNSTLLSKIANVDTTKQPPKTLLNLTARQAWERKYCSVAGLREAFGRNHNIVWGDLDAATTRRLYKCLLPVALLELYEAGHVPPMELAPLAYRARVAAKLYARERSQVPVRMFAAMFDGYRQWRKYGSFDCTGMTYDQVWNKYAALIGQETSQTASEVKDDENNSVTAKICLKILERSCQSNEMIDRLVLKNRKGDKVARKQRQRDLQQLRSVSEQLERDIQLLLQQPDESLDQRHHHAKVLSDAARKQQMQKFRALRAVATVKRRIAALQRPPAASHGRP